MGAAAASSFARMASIKKAGNAKPENIPAIQRSIIIYFLPPFKFRFDESIILLSNRYINLGFTSAARYGILNLTAAAVLPAAAARFPIRTLFYFWRHYL